MLQFALPLRTDLPEGSSLAPRRARPAPAPVSPDYPAILQSPLFTPDRRASDAADGGGLSVVGVIVGHGFTTALISSAGEVRSAHVGGDVGGWRIAAIAPDRVVLEKAGQRAVLPVGGAPAAAPAQPAAAPASQDEQ